MKHVTGAIALLLATAFFPGSASAAAIKAAATIPPLASIVSMVGGDLVEVRTILKPGQSEHTLEPSPSDIKWLAESDMVFRIGFDLELWLDKLMKTAPQKGRVEVDCSAAVPNPIRSTKEESAGHRGHRHGEIDPHYWLDPGTMADVALLIGRKLAARVPTETLAIWRRANQTASALKALDAKIAASLSGPGMSRDFVSFHNAWSYFARRYGLRLAGVIETAPGRDPSARHVMTLTREIRKRGVKAVFAEPQFPPRLAEAIARETKTRVVIVDPLGGTEELKTYEELMLFNAGRFESALKGR